MQELVCVDIAPNFATQTYFKKYGECPISLKICEQKTSLFDNKFKAKQVLTSCNLLSCV